MALARWPQLRLLVEDAESLQGMEVWLFGSAVHSETPGDIDVLVVYQERATVQALRASQHWPDFSPPVNIIAMTPTEVEEYQFIETTGAVRLL